MPYGTATWSSLAGAGGPPLKVVSPVQVFQGHVEVTFDVSSPATWGKVNIGSLLERSRDMQAAVIPLVADDLGNYFSNATTQMIHSKVYGLCFFVMMPGCGPKQMKRFKNQS